jgi:hypothetical protein
MVPEKLSIGLPSMKRPPNVADEVVASLHVSCIFPSRLFARHGSFRNVATAQVLLNVALAGTPTRHSSQVAFPASWNVQQRRSIWLQPGPPPWLPLSSSMPFCRRNRVSSPHDCSGIESLNLRSFGRSDRGCPRGRRGNGGDRRRGRPQPAADLAAAARTEGEVGEVERFTPARGYQVCGVDVKSTRCGVWARQTQPRSIGLVMRRPVFETSACRQDRVYEPYGGRPPRHRLALGGHRA